MSDPTEDADAVSEAAAAHEPAATGGVDAGTAEAVTPPATDLDVPELEIPDADLPELNEPPVALSAPEIPDAVIPRSFLEEPVIPPASAGTPRTRADSHSTWTSQSDAPVSSQTRVRARLAAAAQARGPSVVPEPSLAPEDVVPPESGATPGGYRGLTFVIFGILFVVLIGAIVAVGVLLVGGASPFPVAVSIAGVTESVGALSA